MFAFGNKKGNRRREVKTASAARRPRLDRRNAAKNIDYEVPRASTSSEESTSLHFTRSLDLSPVGCSAESSFRIGGSIDGEVEHLYRMLGLSGPEDFGIPVAAWEASLKARSDIFPRSRLVSSDSFSRKRENSNLASVLPAESPASDLIAESLAEGVVLREKVCVRSPVIEEPVLLEGKRVLDEESEILISFRYGNDQEDAGISISELPAVTASPSPASILSFPPEMPALGPSISNTLYVDDKSRLTPERGFSTVVSDKNEFKSSTEASPVQKEFSVRDEEPVQTWLSSTGCNTHCDVGIKGTRPPVITPPSSILPSRPIMSVLAPPPSMKLPMHDGSSTTWDIVRSFAPTDENKEGNQKALDSEVEEDVEDKEEEDIWVENEGAVDVLERAVALVETTDASGSFSTTNDDDSSSTTTEFVISPNGRFKKQIKSWMRGQLLGSGSFGTVYEGISDDGTFIAIKEVSLLDKGSSAQQCILQLEQEIALLSQFEHENIVQYYGTDKEESKLVIFLELVTQGSLASLYQKYHLRDTQVSAYTRQILNGLNYLHERNVVHRDIKCANILVHANGSVKLADFGLAKEITKFSDLRSCKGSVYWMAPEVVHPKKTYGRAADIWSLGCTVLELLTRQIPFPNVEWQHAFYKIGRGDQPPIPNHLSIEAQDFISKCVQVDPNTRPTAAQLLEHPFVTRRSI